MNRSAEAVAGLCACGCGEGTSIATRNRRQRGQIKGQPVRYVQGHTSQRASLEERFWAKVEKTDDCWIWTGSRDHRGYGRLQRGKLGAGHAKAHRLSYVLAHGPISNDIFVCHRCDNPSCVNPEHLFLGTHRDNMADRKRKARPFGPPFAANPDAVVAFMRAGNTYRAAAAHFRVSKTTIYRHLKRKGEIRTPARA